MIIMRAHVEQYGRSPCVRDACGRREDDDVAVLDGWSLVGRRRERYYYYLQLGSCLGVDALPAAKVALGTPFTAVAWEGGVSCNHPF